MAQFSRISEVVLDTEAPMYVIYTTDVVHNLRIVLNDGVLGDYYTIFAAQSLCDTDAVVIQADSNLFRTLSIEYEDGEQIVTVPLITE